MIKVAIISYDQKYVGDLKEKLNDVDVIPYSDTISFLKDHENVKPDLIIYDTSSGIFAEDDLRYLISKGIDESKLYAIVTSENPIDQSQFEGKIRFYDKFDQLGDLIIEINSLASTQTHKAGETEEEVNYELIIQNPDVQEELIELEEFDILKDITETQSIETTMDIQESSNISTDIFSELQEVSNENEFEHLVEKNIPEIETAITIENLDIELPQELEALEDQLVERKVEIVPDITEVSEQKEVKKFKVNDLISASEEGPEIKESGGESMVANFNIQVSEEEIKKLALQIARDFLEKDPAMEKIVDHLQIDFQEETRKEMENLKLELREKVRKEAESLLSEEIERLIKEELKDYVAEITARIVKEKMEQIFKTS